MSRLENVGCPSHIIALRRGDEYFILAYPDGEENLVHEHLASMAKDKELSFSWVDAATLSQTAQDLHYNIPKHEYGACLLPKTAVRQKIWNMLTQMGCFEDLLKPQ